MVQTISANILLNIPEDKILVEKVDYDTLKNESLVGVYWNIKDVSKRINHSSEWIKENILYVTKFKRVLDSEKGGCVFYPRAQGQPWQFEALAFSRFLQENFSNIFLNLSNK